TLKNYLFLDEVERVYGDIAMGGRVLHESRKPGPQGTSTQVDFYRHDIGDTELESVAETFRSLFLTCGPRVATFESQFAEYLGVEHVVGVTSCTMGLVLA